VDDATMPSRERLPRPFKPLAGLKAATLRHSSWAQDVDAPMDALPRRAADLAGDGTAQDEAASVRASLGPVAAREAPNSDHYIDMTDSLADGSLVPTLGAADGHVPGTRALVACRPPRISPVPSRSGSGLLRGHRIWLASRSTAR
jgi:hypothetical protein